MSQTFATALVLDGQLSSALAASRDLARRGVRVIVGAPRATALTLHSRAAAETFVYPDPKEDLPGYLAAIRAIAEAEYRRSGQQLVPYFFSDDTFLPVARSGGEVRAVLAWEYGSLSSIEAVFDKAETLEAANRLGLPIPEVVQLSDLDFRYPIIVKPRHSCVWSASGKAVRGTAVRVSSFKELQLCVSEFQRTMGEAPLLQDCIIGEEVGVFTVCTDGQPQGWFSHHRLLGIHPNGGASSVRLSTAAPTELVNWSSSLLRVLNWSGPAMVEWKYDEVAQTYRLMEINGRWWGSLALTLVAGSPFVWQWYLHSIKQPVSMEQSSPELNVRAVHLLATLKCFLSCLRLGRIPQAFTALRLCLPSFAQRVVFDVESWRDPAPFFWEIVDVIARTRGTR